MSKVVEFINLECVVCGRIQLIMKIIDDIAMCPRCFHKEFKTNNPIVNEKDKYDKWLAKCDIKVTDYRYTEDGVEDKFKKDK